MPNTFLNPQIIELDSLDFKKIDILTGSAILAQADFAVTHAGSILGLSIEVDRNINQLTKSTAQTSPIAFTTTNASFYVSNNTDANISSSVVLNSNILTSQFHSNFNAGGDAKNLIHGALFTLIVKSIFQGIDARNLDFYNSTVRSNNIFFQGDATEGPVGGRSVVDDIAYKTKAVFNTTTSGVTDEFEYWNVRTAVENDLEQDHVPFNNDDVIYVYYTINMNFISGSMDNVGYYNDFSELDALSATGSTYTPFSLSLIHI